MYVKHETSLPPTKENGMVQEEGASVSHPDGRELKILRASRELFLEHGYAATSMDQVAQHAHVSKTTLYTRFPSKEALFFATVQWCCSEYGMVFTPDTFNHLSIRDALRAIATRFLALVDSPEATRVEQVIIGESVRFPEIGKIFIEAGPALTIATVASFMESAIQRGLLAARDPVLMARHFLMAIKARGAGGDPACPVPMPGGLDDTLDLFLDGALTRSN